MARDGVDSASRRATLHLSRYKGGYLDPLLPRPRRRLADRRWGTGKRVWRASCVATSVTIPRTSRGHSLVLDILAFSAQTCIAACELRSHSARPDPYIPCRVARGMRCPCCVAATVTNIHAIAVNALGRIQHVPKSGCGTSREAGGFFRDGRGESAGLDRWPTGCVAGYGIPFPAASGQRAEPDLTRAEILEGINVGDYAVSERAVDVQIVSLRKKLGSAASRIETVRGQGYRFRGLPPTSSTS